MIVNPNEYEINTNQRELLMNSSNQKPIEPVDPTLNLPGENYNSYLPQPIGLRDNFEKPKVDKKRLSLELFNEIARSQNISEEEKEKYNILAQQINQNYLYSYDDISEKNVNLEQNMKYIEQNLENPILINIPEEISYDVYLTKIGEKCNGLKKRHAIIKRGQLFSSNKPINELKVTDYKKLKDKTKFLKGSEIYIEEYNAEVKPQGEWADKKKPYRIRIDYVSKEEDKKQKISSFCLYFDDENKMKEVYITLFGICLSDEKKQKITKNFSDFQKNFEKGSRNYTILKILSVKNKIKKRKKVFSKIDQAIKGKIYGELDLNEFKIKKKLPQIINKDYAEAETPIFRNIPHPKPHTIVFSDFLPLISNISSNCGNYGNNNDESTRIKRKSLDDLIKKYESLKDEIPNEIINENNIGLNDDGISFKIQNVQIRKKEEIQDFKLESDVLDDAKYIYFDKNKPEIKFMTENNNENSNNFNEGEIKNKNLDIDILSDNNIYEISNIILNSNIDIDGNQENNLVICGPKMNNNVGITYQYKNDDNLYIDPEDINIKSKIVNVYNKDQINGITLQIVQSEIDINEHKLKEFYQNYTGSIIEGINIEEIKDSILFGYTIKLSDLKRIESIYIPPKDYKNHICFIQYNHQYFIPEEYMDKDIIIECFCIPVIFFSKLENNIENEKKGYIGKLLSLFKIGYVKINSNTIKEGECKYPIENNGIQESNNFLIIQASNDSIDNFKLKNIQGKDYSIGSDSYVEKIINKEFIDKAKNNEYIPDDIKDKYFNVCFDDENNFILRPNENMDINDFENDIKNNLINEPDPKSIIDKMKINQKYNYLPCCEKYFGEKTLSENKNLCFSEEQKNYIRNNYKEDDWIYKIPEIKVRFLSKNLGCTNNSISQLIYCTAEKNSFPLKALNNNNNEDKIVLINENNFNVIDKNEINNINNIDNFQWKTSIQFNNKLQMNSFLKLLILAKQNINIKEKNKKENLKTNDIDIEKMIDFDNKKRLNLDSDESGGAYGIGEKTKKCTIRVEFIDFINKMNVKYDPTYIRIIIFIKGNNYKSIFSLLDARDKNEDGNEVFKNSLVEDKRIKEIIEKLNKYQGNDPPLEFPKKIKIDKDKFNSGGRNLLLGNKIVNDVNIKKQLKNFEIIILISDKKQRNVDQYKSIVNLPDSPELCHKFELPIYKKDDKEEKIYGCIGIDLYEKKFDFNEKFEELNIKYIKEPLLILNDQINDDKIKKNENGINNNSIHNSLYNISNSINNNIINSINNNIYNIQAIDFHFGLNEPNIFRRKTLNFIHNSGININPVDLENSNQDDLDKLYERLKKKCIKLPQKEDFSSFKSFDIKKNFDKDDNPYKKKLALKLLKIRRHENFMKEFREKEWNLYFNIMNKGKLKPSIQQYIDEISDKKIYIQNNNNDPNKIRELIYLGIPQKYRVNLYNSFLETDKLYEKTRELLKEKENIDLVGKKSVFSHFADKTFEKDNTETNLVFSLIDNDSTFLWSLGNMSLEDIKTIKKIAKSFFIWAKLRIGLEENDKYVYFIGLLSIIQKFKQIFEEDYIVFWILIGFSQYMDHFHQRNPLFTEDMNYINLYGLVCKLILESNLEDNKNLTEPFRKRKELKKIYDKFISLNFPIEFFLSKHLSTLYTDYFNHELMMRILDIIIFEASYKNINKDRLQSLRVLCTIPITLMELNKNRILSCESVSEIESIFNDLALHTFNHNKFIVALEENFREFFVCSNIFEKIWLFNNKGRKWDLKRDEMERLISEHFRPVYKENKKYLYEINKSLNKDIGQMYKEYFNNLKNRLKPIRSVYYKHESYYDGDSNMETGVMIHVSKLQQIYNNDNKDIQEYKLIFTFGENVSTIGNYDKKEVEFQFDINKNKIINIQDLFFKESFEGYNFPKYIHFQLIEKNSEHLLATFAYQVLHYEPMKISKIVLENKEVNRKYFLEIVIFKYTSKQLASDDTELFEIIFDAPEYIHSKQIEEKLYNYSISNYFFNKELGKFINEENKIKNKLLNYNQFVQNMDSNYKLLNNYYNKEDEYNNENWKQTNKIASQREKVANYFIQDEIKDLVVKWLKETNISIEEVLYSLVLIDKSLSTINQKLFLLYSIAQTKDKLLFSNDKLSLDKAKELIYSLYKRFMIFFTKTDVERMIDFILKDERLYNVKYAFIYNKKNINKINDFIFDKDRYEPKLDEKKNFEIFFDNIDKELNLYLNHLNNHYKMQSLSKDIIILILSEIVNKKKYTFNKDEKFDSITLIIEKDNIIFRRNYTIEYEDLEKKKFKIIIEDNDSNFNVQTKNDNNGLQIVDFQLCHEISNFETNNSYSVNNYISFDKFKEIFFKLPYLSDLFRVSFTYIEEDNDTINKELDNLVVSIEYQDNLSIDDYKIKNSSIISLNSNNIYGIFYFPRNENEIQINNNEAKIRYDMDCNIKISDTVDNILEKIMKFLENKKSTKIKNLSNKEKFLIDNLKLIDKINCYIYYYLDENKMEEKKSEKIGYFDRLYSCIELKDKHIAELKIIFNMDSYSYNSNSNLVSRKDGYCKIFYSNNNDFIWKKCKVKKNKISDVKLTSTDYKSKPLLNNDDVVFAFNI